MDKKKINGADITDKNKINGANLADKYKTNIAEIRKIMKEMKYEKYALENPALIEMDEYTKSLYLKVLCTLIHYENEPSNMQIIYLRRIISGMDVELPAEEYLRMALDISPVDIEEFINLMKDKDVKYYFALNGLILVSVGKAKKANYEYLAEIIDLIDIGLHELQYLMVIAKSIIQQSSEIFDTSKNMISDKARNLNFTPYIQDFYRGAIVDTYIEKYYYTPDKQKIEALNHGMIFKERKVTFVNIEIEINDNWEFEGCEEVIFKSCKINCKSGTMHFISIGNLCFYDCVFSNFNNRVAVMTSVNNIYIERNEFIECGSSGDVEETPSRGSNYGGVFLIDKGECNSVIINNNSLMNCYVKRSVHNLFYGVNGVFIAFNFQNIDYFELKNNDFIGCRSINGDSETVLIYGENIIKLVEENNRCTGEIRRIFENISRYY